jgi:hypothetical protein
MTTLREAAQQALEAMENCTSEHGHRCTRCDSEVDEGGRVVTALRAALAQEEQEQEPVAWRIRRIDPVRDWTLMYRRPTTEEQFSNMEVQPLYAAPPRREWKSLSGEEVKTAIGASEDFWAKSSLWITSIARAFEAKLKELNHG